MNQQWKTKRNSLFLKNIFWQTDDLNSQKNKGNQPTQIIIEQWIKKDEKPGHQPTQQPNDSKSLITREQNVLTRLSLRVKWTWMREARTSTNFLYSLLYCTSYLCNAQLSTSRRNIVRYEFFPRQGLFTVFLSNHSLHTRRDVSLTIRLTIEETNDTVLNVSSELCH